MAVQHHYRSLPGVTSSTDLTASGMVFVKIDGSCTVGPTALGEAMDAVAMNCPNVGDAVTTAGVGDLARVRASGAIAAGDLVSSDANGEAKVAAAGEFIAGRALDAVAAAGEIVEVYLTFPGVAV